MLEGCSNVDCSSENLLFDKIVLVHILRVSLQDVDGSKSCLLDQFGLDNAGARHGTTIGCKSRHDSWASFLVVQAGNGIVGIVIFTALASGLVLHIVVIEPMTLALGTVYAEHVLEQVGHDPVGLLHLYFLVALGAGQIPIGFVSVGHVALVASEL